MAVVTARNNLLGLKNQSQGQHWELTNDFDVLLSTLLAEDAQSAVEFRDAARRGEALHQLKTAMEKIRALWSEIFPGRELYIQDNAPKVKNALTGDTYSGNTMSDGERAALYLAGKVISTSATALVIDEPETHFHSLLAIRFWDALEAESPNVRLIYITHDLTFALSRRNATIVMAHPTNGLNVVELGQKLPGDMAELILGAASLSFYARRVVLCEGEESGIDSELYRAWFSEHDTEVRAVGSCEMVLRCAQALKSSGLVATLETIGIIDRDFLPDNLLANLPQGVVALPLHEVESLYCLPGLVKAVAGHLGRIFDESVYIKQLRSSITDHERHRVIVERWKRGLEPMLEGLLGEVSARRGTLDAIAKAIPATFDYRQWTFSPEDLLAKEKLGVEAVVPDGEIRSMLAYMPGKALLGVTASYVGLRPADYRKLVNSALRGKDDQLKKLGIAIQAELKDLLPSRAAS